MHLTSIDFKLLMNFAKSERKNKNGEKTVPEDSTPTTKPIKYRRKRIEAQYFSGMQIPDLSLSQMQIHRVFMREIIRI